MRVRPVPLLVAILLGLLSSSRLAPVLAQPADSGEVAAVAAAGKPQPAKKPLAFVSVKATTPAAKALLKKLSEASKLSVDSSDPARLQERARGSIRRAAERSLGDELELLDQARAAKRSITKKGGAASEGDRKRLAKLDAQIASLQGRIATRKAEIKQLTSGKMPKVGGWNAKGLPTLALSESKSGGAAFVLKTARGEVLPAEGVIGPEGSQVLVIARVEAGAPNDPIATKDASEAAVLGITITNGGGRYQAAVWPKVENMQDMLTKAPAWVSPPMSEGALALFAVDAGVTVAAVGAQAVPAAVALSAAIAAADENGKAEGTWGLTTVTCYPPTTTIVDRKDVECLIPTPLPETPPVGVLRCEFAVSCECRAGRSDGDTYDRPTSNGTPCFDWRPKPASPNKPSDSRQPICPGSECDECADKTEYKITTEHPGVVCDPLDPQGFRDAIRALCDPGQHESRAVSACRSQCAINYEPYEETIECLTYPPGKEPRRLKAA